MRRSGRHRSTRLLGVTVAVLVASTLAPGCSDDADDGVGPDRDLTSSTTTLPEAVHHLPSGDALAAATTYADVAHAAYTDAVTGAEALRASIGSMVTTPSEATLAAARQTWVTAREHYGMTEVFGSYGGPVDALERRINGWPVEAAHLDGLVADLEGLPALTVEALAARTGPAVGDPVATGFHAIEFLLWGPDANPDGPGRRPATDFTTAPDADRRRLVLVVLADLLVADLTSVRNQWDPAAGEFRARFLADPQGAVQSALQGMAVLSAGEMAGRRLLAPMEAGQPETEYARFSDNTLNDLVANAQGVRAAYFGEYEGVEGTSLSEVVARLDPERDADLRKQIDNNLAAIRALPGQFDQVVLAPDDDVDRVEFVAVADDVRVQGEAVVALAATLGLTIRSGT